MHEAWVGRKFWFGCRALDIVVDESCGMSPGNNLVPLRAQAAQAFFQVLLRNAAGMTH